jgi:hypothetical protein
MYAVIRRYSGVAKLISELDSKQAEVRKLVSDGPGFIAYYAIRDGEALATVTICKDREGAEESTRRTAQWVRENLPNLRASAPEAVGGEVFIHAPE